MINLAEVRLDLHVRVTHFFLQFIGVWSSATNREINYKRVVFFVCSLTPAFIGQLLKSSTTLEDVSVSTQALLHASITGHALFVYLLILRHQTTVDRLMRLIEADFYNFETTVNQSMQLKKTSSVFVLLFVVMSIICIAGFLYLTRFYSFHLDYTEKELLFPIFLPFQMNNASYYLVLCYQLCTFVAEASVQSTSIAMFTLCINSLCSELDVLGEAFVNMSAIVKARASECSSDTRLCSLKTVEEHVDSHARALLPLYVDHHVLLTRFCSDIEKVFRWSLLELFVNCEIMLCLSSFQTYQTFQYTTIGQTVINLNLVIALTWHEFIYFWFGEQLYVKSIDLVRNVFNSGWYNYSLKFRKSFLIILERSKKPLVLYAVIFPVVLTTFIKCLQAAFSYFNLLMALF